jgi:hypothetical protein
MEFTQKCYEGFTSMTDIFLLSMLTGGLAALVEKREESCIYWYKLKKLIKSKKISSTRNWYLSVVLLI